MSKGMIAVKFYSNTRGYKGLHEKKKCEPKFLELFPFMENFTYNRNEQLETEDFDPEEYGSVTPFKQKASSRRRKNIVRLTDGKDEEDNESKKMRTGHSQTFEEENEYSFEASFETPQDSSEVENSASLEDSSSASASADVWLSPPLVAEIDSSEWQTGSLSEILGWVPSVFDYSDPHTN